MFHATGLTGWQRATRDMPTAAPTADAERDCPQGFVESLQSQLDELKRQLAEIETAKTQE
jgi:hypothetical protein